MLVAIHNQSPVPSQIENYIRALKGRSHYATGDAHRRSTASHLPALANPNSKRPNPHPELEGRHMKDASCQAGSFGPHASSLAWHIGVSKVFIAFGARYRQRNCLVCRAVPEVSQLEESNTILLEPISADLAELVGAGHAGIAAERLGNQLRHRSAVLGELRGRGLTGCRRRCRLRTLCTYQQPYKRCYIAIP